MTEQLQGRELDAAVARALGCVVHQATDEGDPVLQWDCERGREDLPHFAGSLNACHRWIWEECERRGWVLTLEWNSHRCAFAEVATEDCGPEYTKEAEHPAAAVCLAFIEAVEAGR